MVQPENPTERARKLPDVASEAAKISASAKDLVLDWVGMKEIEVPILVASPNGQPIRLAAKANAGVSLDSAGSRGIHMSRLYREVQDRFATQELSFGLLEETLDAFLESHVGLSQKAELSLKFDLMLQRKALKSELFAWRTYPVVLTADRSLKSTTRFFIETVVTYSSTCPASAALARQLIQENFKVNFMARDFDFSDVHQWLGSTEGINATPHAQRSLAKVKLQFAPGGPESSFENIDSGLSSMNALAGLIDLIEETLQTPVQGIVKREDEQEFALRNGQNLMFCEDAGRRLKQALLQNTQVVDFCAELRHLESLHPHDAVTQISKGLSLRL